jgi:uncharacterized membrane protein
MGLSVFMTAIVIIGFWAPYFGPLLRGAASRPWWIHLHGIVFVGWMLLLLGQVLLASQGRIQQHRFLGKIGIVYGSLVVIVGVVVAISASILHLENGDWSIDRAAGFLAIGLRAIAVFGGFFAAAMLFRRKPDNHKRLILLATVALLYAPAGRLVNVETPLFLIVWLSPLLLAMGHDFFTRRRVDPTFIIGLVVLIAGFTPILLSQSESVRIGRSILGIFNPS